MAVTPKLRKLIEARDGHCYHCGKTEDLQIHHRKNRGMGSSKLLDTPDNLMQVCAEWNYSMEANAELAATARGWGHKLPAWERLEMPVFDRTDFKWYFLLPDGGKVLSTWSDQPF